MQPVINEQMSSSHPNDNPEVFSAVKELYPQINETLEAAILDTSMRTILKLPVSDLIRKLNGAEGAKVLVLDGIITQRLVEAADRVGIEYIVGHRTGDLKRTSDIKVHVRFMTWVLSIRCHNGHQASANTNDGSSPVIGGPP